jgi:uncharacterized protein (DUF3084 family)
MIEHLRSQLEVSHTDLKQKQEELNEALLELDQLRDQLEVSKIHPSSLMLLGGQ